MFFEVPLWTKIGGSRPNKNVNVMRPFEAVRPVILHQLTEFFKQRMIVDTGLLKSLEPLYNPGGEFSRERIQECHSIIAGDLELREYSAAYKDFVRSGSLVGLGLEDLLEKALQRPVWKPVAIALARIVAATPHSCDVERLISSYNRIKTIDRSSLTPETINDYLHIDVNMPVLSEWNPWKAVQLWISEKDRRQIKSSPQMNSDYFVGVFRDAMYSAELDGSTQESIKF